MATPGQIRIGFSYDPTGNQDVFLVNKKFRETMEIFAAAMKKREHGINLTAEDRANLARTQATALTKMEEASLWTEKALTLPLTSGSDVPPP